MARRGPRRPVTIGNLPGPPRTSFIMLHSARDWHNWALGIIRYARECGFRLDSYLMGRPQLGDEKYMVAPPGPMPDGYALAQAPAFRADSDDELYDFFHTYKEWTDDGLARDAVRAANIQAWKRHLWCRMAQTKVRQRIRDSTSGRFRQIAEGSSDIRDQYLALDAATIEARRERARNQYRTATNRPASEKSSGWIHRWLEAAWNAEEVGLPEVQGQKAAMDFLGMIKDLDPYSYAAGMRKLEHMAESKPTRKGWVRMQKLPDSIVYDYQQLRMQRQMAASFDKRLVRQARESRGTEEALSLWYP